MTRNVTDRQSLIISLHELMLVTPTLNGVRARTMRSGSSMKALMLRFMSSGSSRPVKTGIVLRAGDFLSTLSLHFQAQGPYRQDHIT
jgi:hypothetical protein